MIKAVYYMIRAFLKKLREDTVAAFAAQAAFFVILSFIPFVMFLLTLLKFLPITAEDLISMSESFFPPAVHDFIALVLNEVFLKTSGALLSFSVVAALWSASKSFLVIMQGLNSVYGNPETRNYFVIRIFSTFYTLIFAVVLILTLIFLGFGNQIYLYIQSKVPILENAALLLISIRTTVAFVALTAYFLGLYLWIPNRKSRFRRELPGAVFSAVGWLGFSYLYSFYIDRISNFSAMYGSLTAIVLCMIWLYACMYIMFIGAEWNVIVSDDSVRAAWKDFLNSFKRKKRLE